MCFILWAFLLHHVRGRCRRPSTALFFFFRTPTTAQHNATSPDHSAKQVVSKRVRQRNQLEKASTVLKDRKDRTALRNQPTQSRKASTWPSVCENASKADKVGERQQTSSTKAHAASCFKKKTNQSKSARPISTKKITTHIALV